MSNNIRRETIQAIYQHIHYNRDELKAEEVLDKFLEDRTATLNSRITEQQEGIKELSKWVREGQATHTKQLAKIRAYEEILQYIATTAPASTFLNGEAMVSDPPYIKVCNHHMYYARKALNELKEKV